MLYKNFNLVIIDIVVLGGELVQNLLSIPQVISAQVLCIKWYNICVEIKLILLFTLNHL